MRTFRVSVGELQIGYVQVPANSKDALSAAEKLADSEFGLWDRLEEV